MIDANLKVADEVSDEFVNEVLLQSMEEFMDFGTTYKGAVNRYKEMFLRGRTNVSIYYRVLNTGHWHKQVTNCFSRFQIMRYNQYMIAIINNCQTFRELSQGLKNTWWRHGSGWNKDDAIFKVYLELATLYQVRSRTIQNVLSN